ncbi:MerR family DNA-binding transcriptional regulator [Christensenella sp.]
MFTIGEFSALCQVTTKTLRHYDRISLLRSVAVPRYVFYPEM